MLLLGCLLVLGRQALGQGVEDLVQLVLGENDGGLSEAHAGRRFVVVRGGVGQGFRVAFFGNLVDPFGFLQRVVDVGQLVLLPGINGLEPVAIVVQRGQIPRSAGAVGFELLVQAAERRPLLFIQGEILVVFPLQGGPFDLGHVGDFVMRRIERGVAASQHQRSGCQSPRHGQTPSDPSFSGHGRSSLHH